MKLSDNLARISIIFIDTAPIIYYIEAHPQFGPLVKEVVDRFQFGEITAFSSVITLTEVLPKPIKLGNENLAKTFAEFLKYGQNMNLIEISEGIAEKAGILRGQYLSLKAVDAIQIASAIDIGADVFLTNDRKLKQIKEIEVLVLEDYVWN